MKSIRKDLFECLDKHGEQTMDDLVNRIDGYTRGQLSNNLQAARKEELIASRRDDVTGGPCYKLTPAGKDRLKEIRQKACVQEKPKSETQSPLASTRETQKPIELRAVDIAVNRYNEAAELRAKLALAEKQRDEHFTQAEDYKSQLEVAESAVHYWIELAAEYECKSIPDLRVLLGSYENRVATLQMAVDSLREQLDGNPVDASLQSASATQFVVKTPSKPPRFTKKHSNAHAAAMSAARQNGFAEVFALVPVGKAVRGAEWRPK